MAEAIKKVRLKTTLVLRLICKRFIDVLFPPMPSNNGHYGIATRRLLLRNQNKLIM
jgi:hypothetical protein